MARKTEINREKHAERTLQRNRELLKNAEVAYQEVPTQEEMLNGGKPVWEPRPRKKGDPVLTAEIDEILYEACQQGNIGGG